MLFKRLSAFAGGFTLEAAESVGTGGGIEEGDVLDLLSMLLDKSLVVAVESWEKGARYRLLEPVRQYAQERLEESGESESARNQHAAFFLALAAKAEPQLKGSGQVEWLERLEEDNDNLRAAMAWLLEEGKVEAAIRMAWALWLYLADPRTPGRGTPLGRRGADERWRPAYQHTGEGADGPVYYVLRDR